MAERGSAAARPAIQARAIVKRFGAVAALDGVDLDVAPGEVVSLLGPNGSGKSTLLRILGTIVLPDAGTARVGGVDVTADPLAARRHVGLMIGDQRSFYWRLTGRQNLIFFAALHGLAGGQATERVMTLLETVGLSRAADRPVRGYSSGMRARLSLARALLGEPSILLLDEPTQSLDPIAAAGFNELALGLAHREGVGILMASHDLREAVAGSRRVVVLTAGRVVYTHDTAGMDADELEAIFVQHAGERRPPDVVGLEA